MPIPPSQLKPRAAAYRARLWRAALAVVRVVRKSDLAIGYAVIVTGVTVTLMTLPHHVRADFLAQSSTNLVNLHLHPLRVLAGSAFVLPDADALWQVPALLVTYAYAQRVLGRLATVFVAAVGHIGATLAVATMLGAGITQGVLERSLAHASDVGVSYGLVCVLACLTAFLPRRARGPYAAALVAAVAAPALVGVTFTDAGHAVALLLGFGLALVAHRSIVTARQSRA